MTRRSGLSVSAIRFYQRRGLLPPRDVSRGWQRYDADALTRLAVIELAKRTGFTLDEIAFLLDAFDTAGSPAAAWTTMFEAKITEIDLQMQRLNTMRKLLDEALACDCLSLDKAALIPVAVGWAENTAAATHTDSARRRVGR